MDRRLGNSAGAPARAAERGFTLIEVMIALAISIVVLFANIYLFNTAHKELARAKSVTAATNLATSKIADFRAMKVDDINLTAELNTGGALYVRKGCEYVADGGEVFTMLTDVAAACRCDFGTFDEVDDVFACVGEAGERRTQFKRTWVVSAIDLEHATPPVADLVGDLVKIKVDVAWTADNKDHHVTMTTFATGKAQ